MASEPVKHTVAYYVQHRLEEWVMLDAAGKVADAGPLLRVFIGRNIRDIRHAKMVSNIKVTPEPENSKVTLA